MSKITNKNRGRWVRKQDGTWKEGKAAPRQDPEHMRKLPGELVTTNPADPDKIHELDAPHVVSQLTEDFVNANADKPNQRLMPRWFEDVEPGVRGVTLNQERIDIVRFRVIRARIDGAIALLQQGGSTDLSVKHLWFPHNDISVYELREGPAPQSNGERPKHLCNFSLEVDLFSWPQRVLDALKEAGQEVPDPKKLFDTMVVQAAEQRAVDLAVDLEIQQQMAERNAKQGR